MGTLTADVPRLDSHCPHKLATSCRLTSTPNCCACADERPHSRTYRVYIDGVGFVQRGTRWQGYCWFCKEFWTNRLVATEPPLELSQTRIPEIPDQTEFLERWNEFYQGYRIAISTDGVEQRIAVLGEPFKEVSPGYLPRSLDELRAGVSNDAQRPENRFRRRRLTSEEERPEEPQQSLDDAFDALLQEASQDDSIAAVEVMTEPEPTPPWALQEGEQPSEAPIHPQTRRETQTQRNRERFQRLFGSIEDVQQDDYVSPLANMYGRAYDRYRQAEERRAEGTEEAPSLEGLSIQERRDIEEQLLWGVMRESQAMSETLEREGDVWSYAPRSQADLNSDTANLDNIDLRLVEDPTAELARYIQEQSVHNVDGRVIMTGSEASEAIESMIFAQDRYARQELSDFTTQNLPAIPSNTAGPDGSITTTAPSLLDTETASSMDTATATATTTTGSTDLPARSQDLALQLERLRLRHLSATMSASAASTRTSTSTSTSTNAPTNPSTTNSGTALRTTIQEITSELERLRSASEALTSARHSLHFRTSPPEPTLTLDSQPGRPPPMSDADMTKLLACQVCYSQLADTAVLPCGHMVMCRWCADVVIPVRHSHLPVRPSKCPMCRKVVKQRFRIHM